MNEFIEAVVRRTVYRFYITGKQSPRVDGVRVKLQKAVEFKSGNISARLLLNEPVFRRKITKSNKLSDRNHGYSRNKKCPNATAQYRLRLENAYINELHILFSHIKKLICNNDIVLCLLPPL